MPVIAGGVFTSLTVSTNVSLVLLAPLLTVTVIVAAPVCPATGVTVTVRFEAEPPKAEPPKTILSIGTSVGLDDSPLNVRLAAAKSWSQIVKGIAGVGVF